MLQRYLLNKCHVWIKWDHQLLIRWFSKFLMKSCTVWFKEWSFVHADCRKHMQQAPLPERPKTLEGLGLPLEKGREKSIEIDESWWLAKLKITESFPRHGSGQWNEVFAFYLMKEWSDIKLSSIDFTSFYYFPELSLNLEDGTLFSFEIPACC